MRDFLPADIRKRNYVIGIIKEVYESYGFEPLETPAVENIETLTGKYGEEGNQLIYKILKRGDKLAESAKLAESPESDDSANSVNSLADLALRYDLTVPLARVVANNKNDLPKFFKRYQIQPVWRADRPAKGRFREFYQCDVDSIGSRSMLVEVELISAVGDILTKLGFDDFIIRVNHRGILGGILRMRGVDETRFAEALTSIDKLDKIGEKGVIDELVTKGIAKSTATEILESFRIMHTIYATMITSDKLHNLVWWMGDKPFLVGVLKNAREEFIGSPEALEGIDHLLEIARPLDSVDVGKHIKFDFTLARGLSYYTGTIMEINVPDLAGSLGGGGRYDGLIGMFGKEQIPACGFSLGLERILVVMEERGMFPPEIAESTPADVMVTIWNGETIDESLTLANELRKQGLRVTLYPEPDKLGKQMKYADSIKVPYVCVLGESEIADGTVTLKNMKSGEQETVVRSEIGGKINVA